MLIQYKSRRLILILWQLSQTSEIICGSTCKTLENSKMLLETIEEKFSKSYTDLFLPPHLTCPSLFQLPTHLQESLLIPTQDLTILQVNNLMTIIYHIGDHRFMWSLELTLYTSTGLLITSLQRYVSSFSYTCFKSYFSGQSYLGTKIHHHQWKKCTLMVLTYMSLCNPISGRKTFMVNSLEDFQFILEAVVH